MYLIAPILIPVLHVFMPGFFIVSAFLMAFMLVPLNVRYRMDVPQRCLTWWTLWALLGAALSGLPLVSLIGSSLRMEGWIFWALLARFAWQFRAIGYRSADLSVIMMLACLLWMLLHFTGWLVLPKSQMAGLGVGATVLLWSQFRAASVFGIPPLLISQSSSGILATIVGIVIYEIFSRRFDRKVVVFLLIFSFLAACCVFGKRIASLRLDTIGSGARTQLVLQSANWAMGKGRFLLPSSTYCVQDGKNLMYVREGQILKVPWWKVWAGVGLDMESYYLHAAIGPTAVEGEIPDKVHNIIGDIIMTTGMVGYFILLLAFGASLWIAWIDRNIDACSGVSVVVAWIVLGFFNPQGYALHSIAMISFFGIVRKECRSTLRIF